MAFNNWEKFVEEYRKQKDGALPEDTAMRMQELVGPEIVPEKPDTSNYDVNISNTTVPMQGRIETPETFEPGKPGEITHDQKKWELVNDPVEEPVPASSRPDEVQDHTSQAKEPMRETKLEDVFRPSDNDKAAREAGMADLERKRKLGIIPQVVAGFGDAVAAGVSAKGGNAPGGSMERLIKRQEEQYKQGKTDIEQKLRNDPNSDISRQYQDLVARFMQKDPKDPALLGLTANQIAEKIPQIEKLAILRQQDELKRLEMANRPAKEAAASAGQKAVDKAFAKTYEDFIVSGGYAKAMGNLQNLVDLSGRLESGKENITGPIKGRVPEMFRPTSVAARQEAERIIQEGLRATLGAQFTEREGERFLARSYDEKLPEKMNAEKLREAAQTLQSMIRAKKQASDYYEEHGTLTGYKGKLYTVRDGQMVEASPQEFESILSQPIGTKATQPTSFTDKAGRKVTRG